VDPTQRRGYQLRDIAMVSPEEGWAVGSTQPNQNAPLFRTDDPTTHFMDPVLLHYQQGRWDDVPFPVVPTPQVYGPYTPDSRLSSLSMVAASEGWAVGSTVLPSTHQRRADGSTRSRHVDGSTFGVLLHYHAGQWGAIYEERARQFSSVSMTSAQDGWIVGGSTVLRYTGSTWTSVRDPALAQLLHAHRVVAISLEDVWVVGVGSRCLQGSNGFDGDLIEAILHYDGKEWVEQQTDLANSRLFDLAMRAPTEGWAVGQLAGGMGIHPARPEEALIEGYAQGQWQRAAQFAGPAGKRLYSLYGLALVSASEGWAVGSDGLIVPGHSGTWTPVASPTDQTLWSVGMVSPTEGWAVGDQGTILHYQRDVWSQYPGW
jgi:hypothetical protein